MRSGIARQRIRFLLGLAHRTWDLIPFQNPVHDVPRASVIDIASSLQKFHLDLPNAKTRNKEAAEGPMSVQREKRACEDGHRNKIPTTEVQRFKMHGCALNSLRGWSSPCVRVLEVHYAPNTDLRDSGQQSQNSSVATWNRALGGSLKWARSAVPNLDPDEHFVRI